MPDITKCATKNCRLAERCFRIKAPPCEWQSYVVFAPDTSERPCDAFITWAYGPNETIKPLGAFHALANRDL